MIHEQNCHGFSGVCEDYGAQCFHMGFFKVLLSWVNISFHIWFCFYGFVKRIPQLHKFQGPQTASTKPFAVPTLCQGPCWSGCEDSAPGSPSSRNWPWGSLARGSKEGRLHRVTLQCFWQHSAEYSRAWFQIATPEMPCKEVKFSEV